MNHRTIPFQMRSSNGTLWRGTATYDELRSSLHSAIVNGNVAPGGSVAAAIRQDGVYQCLATSCGTLSWDDSTLVTKEHLFDLASVTKPVFAFTLAQMHDRGELDLRAPLGNYLPWTTETPSGEIPLELFLAHRAGLEAHLELFAPLVGQPPTLQRAPRALIDRQAALRQAATARRPECCGPVPDGGFAPTYSDLGYLLLGEVATAVTNAASRVSRLGALVSKEVWRWGIDLRSAEGWGGELTRRAVPTETVAWRGGEIRGVVHDDNTYALAGTDMCGHAGLFGTAQQVLRFGCLMLDCRAGRREILRPETADILFKPRPGGSLRAGFDSRSPEPSSVGRQLGADVAGHLGFTGTSFWCDVAQEVVVVLLTNRVCPTRDNRRIVQARPTVHDRLVASLKEFAKNPTGEAAAANDTSDKERPEDPTTRFEEPD